MTIPAKISTDLASITAQVTAAEPLANASHATIIALQLNAAALVAEIQTALTTTVLIPNIVLSTDSTILDGWIAPSDTPSIIAGVNNVSIAAQNQINLGNMRGSVGRATSNLDQLV